MKPRKKPKIFGRINIGNKKEIIGYFQLVDYFQKKPVPQLEYSLDKEFRGQGIMKRELPKYLKFCKEYGHSKLIANVDNDNLPSVKLLESNGFILLAKFGKIHSYVVDLNFTKKQLLAGLKAMEKAGYSVKHHLIKKREK